jgi:LmbE family N-acetylglucosaminyl deacetylase
MKLLGLKEDNLVFLGYPDFGTFTIFSKYWNTKKAFKNLFTRVNKVPYKNDYSYQAPYVGESILNDYKKVISDYKPTKIFVSHPADVNLDHKTNYLFLQIALQDLNKMIPPVKVYPYLIHCVGWPVPRHYHPELVLTPPKSFLSSQINWLNFNLSPEALEKKHKAILCYRSQTASSAFYLLAFARKNELFGDYPEIVLTKQVSLKDKAPEFFGFARLFNDSNVTESISQESLVEDRGQVSYAVVDNCLFIRIEKPKGLASKFSFMVYLFGYNQKVPFASMPKLRVIIHGRSYRFYDGNKRIVPQNIRVNIDSKELTLRIPLSVLGEPDFILTSLKAYSGKLPVDAIGFRRIVIK